MRRAGRLTGAMHDRPEGSKIGIRGPFGTHFPVDGAMKGRDILFIAGGIGLAPLRSAIQYVLDHRSDYGKVAILYGTKSPGERMFLDELADWSARSDVDYHETVDKADGNWKGHVGVLTTDPPARRGSPRTSRWSSPAARPSCTSSWSSASYSAEVPDHSIYVSLERRMKCGVGKCGHCQINGLYACIDGPVFSFADLAHVREAI